MSDSVTLTEDWTVSWMLTGFVHQQISRLWRVFRMFIPVFCHRESCSVPSEWKSQFLLKEQERIFCRNPLLEFFWHFWPKMPNFSSWHLNLALFQLAYSVIPPDKVSPGRASRFSRSLWALLGIFKADSHLPIFLVKCSQVSWPQHLAIQSGVGLVVSRTLRGERMQRPPTGLISLCSELVFSKKFFQGLAEQLKPTMEL